jgi:DNA-binding protein H-NS
MQSTISSKARSTILWRESVNEEFAKLSDLEILSLIERAKAEVVRRKETGKERLRAEIEAKLKSAGLDLGDLFESESKRTRGSNKAKSEDGQSAVAAKYKNHVTGEAWSGRGRSPKWVTAVMQEREWTVEEFKRSDEFLIA